MLPEFVLPAVCGTESPQAATGINSLPVSLMMAAEYFNAVAFNRFLKSTVKPQGQQLLSEPWGGFSSFLWIKQIHVSRRKVFLAGHTEGSACWCCCAVHGNVGIFTGGKMGMNQLHKVLGTSRTCKILSLSPLAVNRSEKKEKLQ